MTASAQTTAEPTPDPRKAAIARAIGWLRGAGCKFAVVEPDGTKHGELEIAAPAPASSACTPMPAARGSGAG